MLGFPEVPDWLTEPRLAGSCSWSVSGLRREWPQEVWFQVRVGVGRELAQMMEEEELEFVEELEAVLQLTPDVARHRAGERSAPAGGERKGGDWGATLGWTAREAVFGRRRGS